jgi:hypothetical protein
MTQTGETFTYDGQQPSVFCRPSPRFVAFGTVRDQRCSWFHRLIALIANALLSLICP